MASRVAALAAMLHSLSCVSGFVAPVGAPLFLRTGGSAVSILHPASARLAAPPIARLQRSLATTFKMANPTVPITITGVNVEVSTPGIPPLASFFLSLLFPLFASVLRLLRLASAKFFRANLCGAVRGRSVEGITEDLGGPVVLAAFY